MEALEALLTRRTVHQYTPGEVPQEVLEAGLEAAHQAPCHRHTWPWRFTIVGSEGREAIAEVGVVSSPLARVVVVLEDGEAGGVEATVSRALLKLDPEAAERWRTPQPVGG